MKHTLEQQTIISHVTSTKGLTLVDSVAGSGKTTLLVAIANAIPHTNSLYLAYNKSVAVESQRKFPKTTHCMTTHSMAYNATVKASKLKLGTFSHRDIKERISYEMKWDLINHIRSFCLSKHISFKDYANDFALKEPYITLANKYLDLMQTGKIECTHDFYLKFFHILLFNGSLTYNPFDFIMLDEAGDLNEVTLEIFNLLPSKRKIAVGDKYQNIYQFNNTINCFNILNNKGTLLKMTKSFRTSKDIAKKIENFGQTYLDTDMKFTGTYITDATIYSKAYLTRTNSALISKMIELNAQNIPYKLVRSSSVIFKIPLMLCSLKYQGFITNPAYKHIQDDVNHWYENNEIKDTYKSVLSYLAHLYEDDIQLIQAIRLLQRHSKPLIIDTYAESKKHEKLKQSYTLATVHSCKGAEFDEVTIADDLNESISTTINAINAGKNLDFLLPSEIESLNLYYVGISRCSKALYNAKHL